MENILAQTGRIEHLKFMLLETSFLPQVIPTSQGLAVISERTDSRDRVLLTLNVNGKPVQRYYDVSGIKFTDDRIILGSHSADVIGTDAKYLVARYLEGRK